ncbi:hypothetical protein GH721_09840 [Kriegella sp. EG-1]|nr:hypothetical protein [Flavobacteriaceae bacterium EG-1]
MKIILTLLILFSISLNAQNTLSFKKGNNSPKASISEISWMEGHWKGEAFGGIIEEIWSPPLGGSMMFSFKLVSEGKVQFYELGHIREIEQTLVFELKHFHGDLKGWEEKDEVQQFKLIRIADNRLYFDSFTFEKVNSKEINIYGLIHQDEGTAEEVIFNYKRVEF